MQTKNNIMLWFIGLPSGGLDLISIKALTLIKNCKLCICPGSLINRKLLSYCDETIWIQDNLNYQTERIIYFILCSRGIIVKLHSGSMFGYSGINEIIFYLNMLGILFTIIPSIGALDTAFSYLGWEPTSMVNRGIYITRIIKKSIISNKIPCKRMLIETNSIVVFYLSARLIHYVCDVFYQTFGKDYHVICVFKSNWHSEIYLLTNLNHLHNDLKRTSILRISMIISGKSLLTSRYCSHKLMNN
ncbi:Cobalt-precorrin-4 C(11)-methyltransferase [Candidatus Hodgkinia cicadicola]|uniref:Cobalt-precorrin-4 C(11)-methyltransferase n=1 Tax=Candidatus Hodgkinia cicadicola TaxID=573658 RepID=A0ABX4MJG7_9HYPH|nr:Cobalt-precorrin-4 C(11)-methyltransferase [Candidatus Hodgkinia cicadicola]